MPLCLSRPTTSSSNPCCGSWPRILRASRRNKHTKPQPIPLVSLMKIGRSFCRVEHSRFTRIGQAGPMTGSSAQDCRAAPGAVPGKSRQRGSSSWRLTQSRSRLKRRRSWRWVTSGSSCGLSLRAGCPLSRHRLIFSTPHPRSPVLMIVLERHSASSDRPPNQSYWSFLEMSPLRFSRPSFLTYSMRWATGQVVLICSGLGELAMVGSTA